MKRLEQEVFFEDFVAEMRSTLISKSNDYAQTNDVLSNFRKSAEIVNINPQQSCLNHIATKVIRLGNLLDGKDINHESVRDNLMDLANYCILLAMIDSEQ